MSQFFFGILHFLPVVFVLPQAKERKPQADNGNSRHRQAGNKQRERVAGLRQHSGRITIESQEGSSSKAANGKILKSSTFYIHNDDRTAVDYIFSINYDITGLLTVERSIKALIDTEPQTSEKQPDRIVTNVTDLLDSLIEQSVALVGKPAALMNKEEKVMAIQFLNDAGAFLITKSGDKISKYFGISKFTLYSYIDVNSHKSD